MRAAGPGGERGERPLRGAVAGAGVLGFGVLARGSGGGAALWNRYALDYAPLVLAGGIFALSALVFALFARAPRTALWRLLAQGRFWAVGVLAALPAALVAWRFLDSHHDEDLFRLAELGLLFGAFGLWGALAAARLGEAGLRRFLGLSLGAGLALYGIVIGVPLALGDWIERTQGWPADSTLRVVRASEHRAIHDLRSQPGAEFVYPGHPGVVREFEVRVRNNTWGFHDREHRFANPEARRRVVLVGDDYLQALEVPREQAVTAQLQSLLDRAPGRFEVIALGRTGAGQAEELELLRAYGRRLEPELAILLWTPNDLLANDPALLRLRTEVPRAFFFPGLLVDRIAAKWLYRRAYLLDDDLRFAGLRPDHWAYLVPMPAPVERAFRRTEALLDAFLAECRAMGADLLLVMNRPYNELRWLRRFAGLRGRYRFDAEVFDQRIGDWARSRGVGYLDLGAPMQRWYREHPTGDPQQITWPNDGHWNARGHRLTAELIFGHLAQNGALGADPTVADRGAP